MYEFKSNVKVSMDFMDIFGIDMISADAKVSWALDIGADNSGIIGMLIKVPEQILTISGERYDKDDDVVDFEVKVQLAEVKVDVYDMEDFREGLRPKELSHWKNKWTLEF